MRYFLAILFLFSTAFGADTVVNTNKLITGQKSSAADKILEFQINAGAANPKIRVNPAAAKIQFANDGTNYKDLGSGGSGSKNFATLGDAEAGIGTIATYADAAGTSPVDGVSGTPTATIAISGTTPLENLNSFIFTKDAANRQGNGFSLPFTIDLQQRAKVLNISFKYLVNSGTFVAGSAGVDSDVTVWIYDVTNSQLIQPSSYKLLSNNTSLADVFNATFQTSSSSSSYRLIFHIGSTSASAYSLKIDDIQVSPSNYSYGTPITDLIPYTPTFNGSPTITNSAFWWKRMGDHAYIRGSFRITAINASDAAITLPAGLVIDTTKVGTTRKFSFGEGNRIITGGSVALAKWVMSYNTTYPNQMVISGNGGTELLQQVGWNTIFVNNDWFEFEAMVPISGWSSSVQMSDQTDTRVVAGRFAATNSQSLASGANTLQFPTVSNDSHGAFGSNTTYTIPVSGRYNVYAQFATTMVAGASTNIIEIRVNGSVVTRRPYVQTFEVLEYKFDVSDVLNLLVGDQVTISFNNGTGGSRTVVSTAGTNFFTIFRVSGPNQIAANETVAASYHASVNKSVSTVLALDYDTREYDTHNAVTTGASWRFTAPISGIYRIVGSANSTTASGAFLYKNGTIYKSIGAIAVSASAVGVYGTEIRLNAGEYIDVRAGGVLTAVGGALSGAGVSNISITRIGN
jgi:hypothetical protein